MGLFGVLLFIISAFFVDFSVVHASDNASILILETQSKAQPEHADTVLSVACPKKTANCKVSIADFDSDSFAKINKSLENSDIINMSFEYESPYDSEITEQKYEALKAQGLVTEEHEAKHTNRKKLLKLLVSENPEKLFLAPAGNGSSLYHFNNGGVPLGGRHNLYPAILEYENIVKVTAINADFFDKNFRMIYQVADYANYSIDYIDVAAPVVVDEEDTSFALPYVSKLADDINKSLLLTLSPSEMKKVFQKSCYIQDIEKTLHHFKGYKHNRKNSVINEIQNKRLSLKRRNELIDFISPVVLVKCGGVISKEQAMSCAKIYSESGKTKSILDSCLQAYSKEFYVSDDEVQKLKSLWSLFL